MPFVDEMEKDQILIRLDEIGEKSSNKRSAKENYFLSQIRLLVEAEVIEAITRRQAAIQGLNQDDLGYTAVLGGELTPGCKICLNGENGSIPIRSVYECNLNCKFCYYYDTFQHQVVLKGDHFIVADRIMSSQDVKLWISRNLSKVKGVMWVALEPFMEIEKHYGLMRFVSDLSIHQHMYTNGTLVEKAHLISLQNAGLTELRFNLAASNCSDAVIEKMAMARSYVEYLVVESPMFQGFFDAFMEKREKILATGVDHLNLNELHLNYLNYNNFEGPTYQYHDGYVSPIRSRRLTYDLMTVAVDEGWPVVIHDCSNQTKFYRGIRSGLKLGTIDYREEMTLSINWYRDAVERYNLGT